MLYEDSEAEENFEPEEDPESNSELTKDASEESEPALTTDEPTAEPVAPRPHKTWTRSAESRERIRQSQLAQTPEQRERRRLGIQRYHASRPFCCNGHPRAPGLGNCPQCKAAADKRYSATRSRRRGSQIKTAVQLSPRATVGDVGGRLGKTETVPERGMQVGQEESYFWAVAALPIFEFDERFRVVGARAPNAPTGPIDIIRELRLLAIAALDQLGFGPPPRECEGWIVVNDRVLFQAGEGHNLIGPYEDIERFGLRGNRD